MCQEDNTAPILNTGQPLLHRTHRLRAGEHNQLRCSVCSTGRNEDKIIIITVTKNLTDCTLAKNSKSKGARLGAKRR